MLVNVYDAGPALIQRLVFAGYIYNEKGVLPILVIQNIFFYNISHIVTNTGAHLIIA